jgi:hypothetical protein
MLYCNDVHKPFTEEMKKKVEAELGGKWPMVIRMPDHMYTKTSANEKPDRPPMSNVPLIADINDPDEGSQRWVYATGRDKDNDKWVYFNTINGPKQSFLTFTETFTVDKKQIDLAYFLLFLSKGREIPGETLQQQMARGINPNKFRSSFVVQNKEKEAALEMSKRELKRKVENAIMGEKALKLADLRTIASALFISNASEKEEMEIRLEILKTIENLERTKHRDKDGNSGYQIFLKMSKLDEITDIRATIQNCIDMKIIVEDQKETAFYWLSDKGKKQTKITGPIGARTMMESLEHYLKENPNELVNMKTQIEERNLATV